MDEEAEKKSKITMAEAVFIGLGVGVLDLIDLIPVAGDITDLLVWPVNYYMYIKGINGIPFLAGEILDLIPGVQEFPSRSIAWWGTLAYEYFAPEELVEATEKVGEKMQASEGAGGSSAVGGEAASGAASGTGAGAASAEREAAGVRAGAEEGSSEIAAEEKVKGKPSEENASEKSATQKDDEGSMDKEAEGDEKKDAIDYDEAFGQQKDVVSEMQENYFEQDPAEMMRQAEADSQAKEEEEAAANREAEDSVKPRSNVVTMKPRDEDQSQKKAA